MDIVKIPAQILSSPMENVSLEEIKNGSLRELFSSMKEAMKNHNGIGLAANQVGVNKRIFVIDEKVAKEAGIPDIFINPEITEYAKEEDEMEEGCLSIPEYYVQIKRAKKIKIKAYDSEGNKIKLKVRGFAARVLQHETDHLNGMVIKDRAQP
ncbi:MAG TPA: peptide deformylase [Candidatus Paceibacterota bacterium]